MEIRKLNLNKDIVRFERFVSFTLNEKNNNHFRYFNTRNVDVVYDHLVTLIIEKEDEIIGYAHLEFEKKYWFGIYIMPDFRSKGLGKRLWNFVKKFAIENRIYAVHLTVDNDNISAINMYEKLGFIEVAASDTFKEFKYDIFE